MSETEYPLDQFGIPLTPKVVAARAAADALEYTPPANVKLDEEWIRVYRQCSYPAELEPTIKNPECVSDVIPLPEGFVGFMIACLREIGCGNDLIGPNVRYCPQSASMSHYADKRDHADNVRALLNVVKSQRNARWMIVAHNPETQKNMPIEVAAGEFAKCKQILDDKGYKMLEEYDLEFDIETQVTEGLTHRGPVNGVE